VSTEQVTTVGLESALVGEDLNGCAFVYGSLSFLDKISCGIALFVLESYEGSVEISKNRVNAGPNFVCDTMLFCCRHNELRRDEGTEHGEQVRHGPDPLLLRRPLPGGHLHAEAAGRRSESRCTGSAVTCLKQMCSRTGDLPHMMYVIRIQ
jgi:hypothetical protein